MFKLCATIHGALDQKRDRRGVVEDVFLKDVVELVRLLRARKKRVTLQFPQATPIRWILEFGSEARELSEDDHFMMQPLQTSETIAPGVLQWSVSVESVGVRLLTSLAPSN